jgi:hypothetical protein
MLLSTYSCLLLITGLGHVAQLMGWMQLHANCIITLQIKILKKKTKKKNTQQENKRRKKERTEFQTKDHTPKCKIRCSREEHEREYLS